MRSEPLDFPDTDYARARHHHHRLADALGDRARAAASLRVATYGTVAGGERALTGQHLSIKLGEFVVMADSEYSIAGEVHALLLSAHPEHADANLIKAALLASQGQDVGDDLRAVTSTAIQKTIKAIAEGASAAEGEHLLLASIRAAERWATTPV